MSGRAVVVFVAIGIALGTIAGYVYEAFARREPTTVPAIVLEPQTTASQPEAGEGRRRGAGEGPGSPPGADPAGREQDDRGDTGAEPPPSPVPLPAGDDDPDDAADDAEASDGDDTRG